MEAYYLGGRAELFWIASQDEGRISGEYKLQRGRFFFLILRETFQTTGLSSNGMNCLPKSLLILFVKGLNGHSVGHFRTASYTHRLDNFQDSLNTVIPPFCKTVSTGLAG